MVTCSSEKVGALLSHYSKVYLLIVNTPEECVIGGDADGVDEVVRRLKCHWYPIDGVTTVHCDVAKPVEKAYHDLHIFPTNPPAGVRYYSGAWGKSYDVSSETAAASILAQALDGVNYPKVIDAAYDDDIRTFLEMGPGASCSRMIPKILGNRPHLAISACYPARAKNHTFLRFLGKLIGHQFSMNLDFLYGAEPARGPSGEEEQEVAKISAPLGGKSFKVSPPDRDHSDPVLSPLPPVSPLAEVASSEPQPVERESITERWENSPSRPLKHSFAPSPESDDLLVAQLARTAKAQTLAHQQFLVFSDHLQRSMTQVMADQMSLLAQLPPEHRPPPLLHKLELPQAVPKSAEQPVAFDREACFEIAIGKLAKVLGEEFSEIDSHPTRVRLPDSPLMLVDRIISILRRIPLP